MEFGPMTEKLYGKQDVAGFFEKAASPIHLPAEHEFDKVVERTRWKIVRMCACGAIQAADYEFPADA